MSNRFNEKKRIESVYKYIEEVVSEVKRDAARKMYGAK